jgi:hypothetical protein
VTTGLETAPLVILFLASIILLRVADRRDAKRAAAELVDFASSSSSSTSDDDDEA